MESTDEDPQYDLFRAETTWFHVFHSMIWGGDVAKMGPYAFTVYATIKAYTNFKSGSAHPGIPEIMEKSGISKSQVLRALEKLEEFGYITRDRKGRSNRYTLREKVGISDTHGRPIASATWDYVPDGVRGAVADLKNVLMTGDFAGAKIVTIENLTVNIFRDSATQNNINVQNLLENMDKLSPETRAILLKRLAG
jgi:DNA-binding transcriptional ArsR family regulator